MIETRTATPTPPAMLFETNPLPPYPSVFTVGEEDAEDEERDDPDEEAEVEGAFPVAAAWN
jgi:hypothetical protein